MSNLKDPARHDDLLNYRLKRLLTLGGAPAIRLCEGGYGIARMEWRLTAALVESGPMAVGALTQRCGIEPARVSRCIKELERKGLVERTAPERNRHRGVLRATEHGHALYRDLLPRLAAINRRLMEVLTHEEAVLLDGFLQRLNAHAEKIHAEGGGVAIKTGRHLGTARRTAKLWREPSATPGWPARDAPP